MSPSLPCSSLVANRKPMGKLVYHLLSLKDLRRRLRDCHLPTQGQRDHLVRRHQEFVHVYNAQCDSLSPKSGLVGPAFVCVCVCVCARTRYCQSFMQGSCFCWHCLIVVNVHVKCV